MAGEDGIVSRTRYQLYLSCCWCSVVTNPLGCCLRALPMELMEKVCICTRCADIKILISRRKNWSKVGLAVCWWSVLASTALLPKAVAFTSSCCFLGWSCWEEEQWNYRKASLVLADSGVKSAVTPKLCLVFLWKLFSWGCSFIIDWGIELLVVLASIDWKHHYVLSRALLVLGVLLRLPRVCEVVLQY